MKINSSNNYKVPHVEKDLLEYVEDLPTHLPCDAHIVESHNAHIVECACKA